MTSSTRTIAALRAWFIAGGVVVASGVLTSCSDAGDLGVANHSDSTVWVDLGDEQMDVEPDGGVVVLDYGCTPGDVTVDRGDGAPVALPGPICSDRQIIVDVDEVRVVPAS